MNSNESTPTSPAGTSSIPPGSSPSDSSETYVSDLQILPIPVHEVDWKEAPLDYCLTVLNNRTLVSDMTDQQVLDFTKRCAVLRSSHHTMGATLKKEATSLGHKKDKKPAKKDDISLAAAALGLDL